MPPKQHRIGATKVEWFENKPGEAVILCEGGTVDDRHLAEVIVRENLAACGIKQAKFSFDWKESARERFDIDWAAVNKSLEEINPPDRDDFIRNFFGATEEEWPEHHRQMLDIDNNQEDTSLYGFNYNHELADKYNKWYGLRKMWQRSPFLKTWTEHGPHYTGGWGKGIVYDDGTVHTWNTSPRDTWNGPDEVDGEPGHDEYMQWYGIEKKPATAVLIGPDGGYYNKFYNAPAPHPDSQRLLQEAHPEVNWGPPPWEDEELWKEASIKKVTHWNDIMAKAKRLIQSGNVTLLRNGANIIVGHVIGDHGEYQTEISRDDPQSRAITQWTCDCPWDQYAFQRTRQWKKYEARPCAHVLATYWVSQGAPLDEEYGAPGATPTMTQPGVGPGMSVTPGGGHPAFQPGAPPTPPTGNPQIPTFPPSPMPATPPVPAGDPLTMMPGMGMQPGNPQPQGWSISPVPQPSQLPPLMAPPGQNQIIPPYPLADAPNVTPTSVPGGRPGPYPANPVQQPGTFSKTYKVANGEQFVQGMAARLNEATLGQSEGREGAIDAGQWMEIPRNAIIEVRDQDPTTGWVEIIYPLRGGPMTSYHVRCFVEPEKLTPMPGKPSPFQNPKGKR